MSATQDFIGERGESIIRVLLTRFYDQPEPRFRPHFLGEKYPTVDFLVELVGAPAGIVPYFFVQAKATSQGYTMRDHRLKVQVSQADFQRLVSYPAPTYIIGVDEPREVGYILAAISGRVARVPSLPTTHPLNETTLRALYEEVLRYWQTNAADFSASVLS